MKTQLITYYNNVFNLLNTYLTDIVLLVARIYVAWVFLQSGYLKLTSWSSTLFLFQYEYQVPFLGWQTAAYLATITEIAFPILIVLGILTRFNALNLFLVNAMAVISYPALWAGGYYDHKLWGFILLIIILYGGGRFTLDTLLKIK